MAEAAQALGRRFELPWGGPVRYTPVGEHALVAELLPLFCRGRAFADTNPDLHRARLAFNVGLGQWLAWRYPVTGTLRAWAAWWRVDDASAAALKVLGPSRMLTLGIMPRVSGGRHCYIADVIVAPGEPPATYRRLCLAVGRINRDADFLCGHTIRPGREPAWRVRRLGREHGAMNVVINCCCLRMDSLYGSTLVFDSFRTGFPTADTLVIANGCVDACAAVYRAGGGPDRRQLRGGRASGARGRAGEHHRDGAGGRAAGVLRPRHRLLGCGRGRSRRDAHAGRTGC